MAEKKHDGGPAFPRTPSLSTNGQEGMSLRDYFAAQALTAMARNYDFEDARGDEREGAARCYEWADAMLAERAK